MTAALIPIQDRPIGEGSIPAVDARELHAFLGVGRDFSSWIKDRIEQYDFVENQDFGVFTEIGENRLGGRPAKEYCLTLDMAKELAMVERTDKGKQARQYFIECEREAKGGTVAIHRALNDPDALRGMLLGYTEKVIELQAEVATLAPKAAFHDAVAEAINCQTIQEVAKVLGTGMVRLFRFLKSQGILIAGNLPRQEHIEAGRFRVVAKQFKDKRGESHVYHQTLVTGKGLAFIHQRLTKAA